MILLSLLVLSIASVILVIALCRASARGEEVGRMHLAELRRRDDDVPNRPAS